MGMTVISSRKKIDVTKYKEGVCRIGFFDFSRYPEEKNKEGKVIRKSVPVAAVAYWNEFGKGVPERPFMRPAMHQNRAKIIAELRSKYKQAMKDNRNTMLVLEDMGEKVKGLIQEQIRNTTEPANAEITIHGGWMRNKQTGKPIYIEGKGFNAPLRDTHIMWRSVNHQEEEIRK